MEKIISMYDQLVIHKITYETSQSIVTAECELIRHNERIYTSFLISHTDLNRILAKIIAKGYTLDASFYQSFQFEDGTEVIDCEFDNLPEGPVYLEEFEFADYVTEIRA
ncbi:MAG: hypothetical protein IPO32_01015 [Crocinitomicaceae bacterium]|jgi:hypothetical protein|nr:hypothetical protein [Crocinitomicaceae bacterium]MBK6951668.1 hypothetical protein [Crocinitomicaceae bacterium]MBK9590111.1 hypothetical protein [Crocinitomicaceae bacterium]